MAEQTPRGRFVWHDLNTTDPRAGEAFYTSVVGWKILPWADTPDYRMWTRPDGFMLGGIMPLGDDAKAMGAPPHWLPYIATTDVDSTAKQAEGLGGKTLVPPTDIPKVGRFAVV